MDVSGTITDIISNVLTIKTPPGDTVTVKVTSETHFRRDGKDSQLADFRIADTVVISAERDQSGIWNARSIATGSETGNPQEMGKTFIIGEVKKIENTRLTIHRPDGVDQAIEIDDQAILLDGRGETIKLADFKTGDQIIGTGALKNGVFVATDFRKAPPPPPLPPLPFSRQQN
jgi:hypothetical protein